MRNVLQNHKAVARPALICYSIQRIGPNSSQIRPLTSLHAIDSNRPQLVPVLFNRIERPNLPNVARFATARRRFHGVFINLVPVEQAAKSTARAKPGAAEGCALRVMNYR